VEGFGTAKAAISNMQYALQGEPCGALVLEASKLDDGFCLGSACCDRIGDWNNAKVHSDGHPMPNVLGIGPETADEPQPVQCLKQFLWNTSVAAAICRLVNRLDERRTIKKLDWTHPCLPVLNPCPPVPGTDLCPSVSHPDDVMSWRSRRLEVEPAQFKSFIVS
jgi:hypothetical protein